MNLKEKTVPELLDVLNAILNRNLSGTDRKDAALLAEQRTFSRAEKILIGALAKRYSVTQQTVDANLIKA